MAALGSAHGIFPTLSRDHVRILRPQMIQIGIDPAANIITIRTRAFKPQLSQKMASTIIELSEKLVNKLSDRIVNDSLRFARDELDHAEARIRSANDALTLFRSESRSIDPGEETSAVLGIVTFQ